MRERNRPLSRVVVQPLSLLPLILSPPLAAACGRHRLCYGLSIHTTPSAFRLSVLADETSASSGVYDFHSVPLLPRAGPTLRETGSGHRRVSVHNAR
ncbi:uncharacterized protein BDZ83DRAFT_427180 [Colletotrichum acutatum]|uniref:Secreted protein n=1 Tax=Glomerella acutata TaxID=27357 RepID=A0AAD8XMU3_GLOAC|nr:uncharacterized protein BDZ83DRAFT_427180 [Colletotrichum acutatum]KAK1730199.1 hypothetical protein BDZ83DRAFT_427180 [Colletotrichum acutatum]